MTTREVNRILRGKTIARVELNQSVRERSNAGTLMQQVVIYLSDGTRLSFHTQEHPEGADAPRHVRQEKENANMKMNERWNCPRCTRHLEGIALIDRKERATIVNGLRIAAEQFDKDAQTAREAGQTRVAEQFERQARETQQLVEEFGP